MFRILISLFACLKKNSKPLPNPSIFCLQGYEMKGSAMAPDGALLPAMPEKLTFHETSRFCPIKLTNPLLIIPFSDLQG